MKKQLLILISILFLGISTDAQWSFGLKAGISESWHLKGKPKTPTSKNLRLKSINTTLLIYKKITTYNEFGFEPGVIHRGSGESAPLEFEISPQSFINIGGNSLVTTYIQLPVMNRINIPIKKDLLGVFFKIGAGPSWMASANYEKVVFGTGRGPVENINLSGNNDLHRWEFGLYGSIGTSVQLKKGDLSFNIDFYQATMDFSPEDIKNRSNSYSISYDIEL